MSGGSFPSLFSVPTSLLGLPGTTSRIKCLPPNPHFQGCFQGTRPKTVQRKSLTQLPTLPGRTLTCFGGEKKATTKVIASCTLSTADLAVSTHRLRRWQFCVNCVFLFFFQSEILSCNMCVCVCAGVCVLNDFLVLRSGQIAF